MASKKTKTEHDQGREIIRVKNVAPQAFGRPNRPDLVTANGYSCARNGAFVELDGQKLPAGCESFGRHCDDCDHYKR